MAKDWRSGTLVGSGYAIMVSGQAAATAKTKDALRAMWGRATKERGEAIAFPESLVKQVVYVIPPWENAAPVPPAAPAVRTPYQLPDELVRLRAEVAALSAGRTMPDAEPLSEVRSEDVECGAIALCWASTSYNGTPDKSTWPFAAEHARNDYRDKARAVLEAVQARQTEGR